MSFKNETPAQTMITTATSNLPLSHRSSVAQQSSERNSSICAPVSKFKNIYASNPFKTLYTNVKVDATAVTKLKANESFFAIPLSTGLSVYPIKTLANETVKIENNYPLMLAHGKPISDFEFSPIEASILASTVRTDGLIRLWKLPLDLQSQPNTQLPQREMDVAAIYLASHEKKVELLKFHPTVGSILLSSAIDSLIKLWEIETMQDILTLTCPNDSFVNSISFDYNGNIISATSADANFHLFDARANTSLVHSLITGFSPAKSSKACWLTPNPYVAISGFKDKGVRELLLFDTRALDQGPVQALPISAGVGLLSPVWDTALPLLYLLGKSEGIRTLEFSYGELKEISTIKVEKQATAFDIMPKFVYSTKKCEIARFLHLGTNNAVDITSINVPRTNGEIVFQEDLYPAMATIDPAESAHSWFHENISIEPAVVDFITLQELKDAPLAANVSIRISHTSKRSRARAPSLQINPPNSNSGSSLRLSVSGSPNILMDQSLNFVVMVDGYATLERKGWFGSYWDPYYLSLKKSRLYVFLEQDSESPRFHISLNIIKKIDGFTIGRETTPGSNNHQTGLLIETQEMTWRFRFKSCMERENWIKTMQSAVSASKGENIVKDTQSAIVVKSASFKLDKTIQRNVNNTSLNDNKGILFGELECLDPLLKGKIIWIKRLVTLDEDGLIHIYNNDLKAFSQKKAPIESMNLTSAISIRLTDIMAGASTWNNAQTESGAMDIFQINTTKRILFFKAHSTYEAANWVLEVRKLVTELELLPASDLLCRDVTEGVILNVDSILQKSSIALPICGAHSWLSVIDGSFYYFASNLSPYPIYVIGASQFEIVKLPTVELSPNEDVGVFFDVVFKDETLRHIVSSEQEKGIWIKELANNRIESFDLLSKIGIVKDQTLREEISKVKGEVFPEDGMPNVEYLDDKRIEKGEQRSLIATVGRSKLLIALVECTYQSLKNDGSFVLDMGSNIYHWNGPASSRMCQARAMGVAGRLRKERGTRPKIHLVENDDKDLFQKFIGLLGLLPSDPNFAVFTKEIPISDLAYLERLPPFQIFKVADSKIRKRRLQLIYEGFAPSKSILESDQVYILSAPPGEVFVWYGKNSCNENRSIANVVARRLAIQMQEAAVNNCVGRVWITVQRVYENNEYAVWKEKFIDYEGSLPISMRMETEKKGNIVQNIQQIPIDVRKLLIPMEILDTSCVDDGNLGNLRIYRVKDFLREEVAKHHFGQFFRGESYILLYTYRPIGSGVDKCISYFWQGSESSITEKGTSALMTIELTDQTKGDVTQVRVVEGKGTADFETTCKSSDAIAFDIREMHSGGMCKIVESTLLEVPFHSNHVTVVLTALESYIWVGQFSKSCEERCAKESILRLHSTTQCPITIIKEGKELPGTLMQILKSAGNVYAVTLKSGAQQIPRFSIPRLFSCSSGSGMVKVEEVPQFTQEDLDTNIVLILDSDCKIYVWIGAWAKTVEKTMALQITKEYLELSTSHRKSTDMVVIHAYQELPDFTRYFHGWTRCKFPKDKRSLEGGEQALEQVLKEYQKKTYAVEVLLGDKLPENVDPTRLEMYLSDDDFENIFGMNMAAYMKIQPWKREEIRRKFGFF